MLKQNAAFKSLHSYIHVSLHIPYVYELLYYVWKKEPYIISIKLNLYYTFKNTLIFWKINSMLIFLKPIFFYIIWKTNNISIKGTLLKKIPYTFNIFFNYIWRNFKGFWTLNPYVKVVFSMYVYRKMIFSKVRLGCVTWKRSYGLKILPENFHYIWIVFRNIV